MVDRYTEWEVYLALIIGLADPKELLTAQISCFGVIPKNHQPGKWRLIVDLSHPEGASINEGIEPELCNMRYTSVDEAVARVCALGARAYLSSTKLPKPLHAETTDFNSELECSWFNCNKRSGELYNNAQSHGTSL